VQLLQLLHADMPLLVCISGAVAGEGGGGNCPNAKFWAVRKFSFCQKISSKMQNLGPKTPFWENFRAKLKF